MEAALRHSKCNEVSLDSDGCDKWQGHNESEIAPRIQAGWDKMCCFPKMFLRVLQKSFVHSIEPKADMFRSCDYLYNLRVVGTMSISVVIPIKLNKTSELDHLHKSKYEIQQVPKQ